MAPIDGRIGRGGLRRVSRLHSIRHAATPDAQTRIDEPCSIVFDYRRVPAACQALRGRVGAQHGQEVHRGVTSESGSGGSRLFVRHSTGLVREASALDATIFNAVFSAPVGATLAFGLFWGLPAFPEADPVWRHDLASCSTSRC